MIVYFNTITISLNSFSSISKGKTIQKIYLKEWRVPGKSNSKLMFLVMKITQTFKELTININQHKSE